MPRITKPFALVAVAATALALSACTTEAETGDPASTEAADPDHVTIQLDYQVRGLHAPLFVGDVEGYFEEEGIIIDDILTGTSSGDTLRLVAQGQGDFGVSDLPTLVTAQSQEADVTAIVATQQYSPLGMCAKASRFDLQTPEDLIGLNVSVQASGSTYVFYRALLAANGIDPSELTQLTVTPPYESYLVTDQVDVVPCYSDAEVPILEMAAGELSILPGAEWGYDLYGTGLFVSDEMAESNPDLVQRFTNAYLKALQSVIDDPDAAATILAESDPQRADNAELYLAQLEASIANTFTSDATDEFGLGAMTDERWQITIDTLADQGVIETSPTVEEVMTTQFITVANE